MKSNVTYRPPMADEPGGITTQDMLQLVVKGAAKFVVLPQGVMIAIGHTLIDESSFRQRTGYTGAWPAQSQVEGGD